MGNLFSTRDVVSALEKRFTGKEIPRFRVILEGGAAHYFGPGGNGAHKEGAVTSGEGGPGKEDGAAFTVTVQNRSGARALASLDELAFAKAYMNDDIDIAGDFLALLDLRKYLSDNHPLCSIWRFLRPLFFSQVKNDKKLVPQHYDQGNEFYFTFLDKKARLYSQALYKTEQDTLEQAAQNKLDYILEICRLKAGSHVLDVGAGWGSFSKYAASKGISVNMLTISHEQFKYLTELSNNHDHPSKLKAIYESVYAYTAPQEYDAIVILGVMEHLPDYSGLFSRFAQLLKPNGRVYMDFVATRKKYNISTFTYQNVFQGNHTPVIMPDLLAAANGSPFELVAAHNDRHSYFLTLQAWARNLEAASVELCRRFGEKTYRLFRMYLWAAAHDLYREAELESYRVVFEKSMGRPSGGVGL